MAGLRASRTVRKLWRCRRRSSRAHLTSWCKVRPCVFLLPVQHIITVTPLDLLDGILKRKGKGYNFDVAAAPAPVGAATSAAPVLMTPQDSPGNSCAETSVSTASRLAHAPPAPRKSAAAKPPAAPAEEMTDDIEDTYQEPAAVTAARTVTPATTALRQPALQLQGKKSGTEDQEVRCPCYHQEHV